MDAEQQRITEDLSGLLKGEIRCDPLTTAMYASDGSVYQIQPLGVATPRDHDDVVTLARYAADFGIPLIARGGGTGLAGQCLGQGLIVDFSRYMRHIESVGTHTVRVQPGIVRDQLNRALREHGRYFPPDPAGSAVTTLGSMLAVDAGGSHYVRVGSTRDHVESIRLVLAGGRTMEAGGESLDLLKTAPLAPQRRRPAATGNAAESDPESAQLKRTIVSKLAKLLADHDALIQQRQPLVLPNSCGYQLRGVLRDDCLHLPRLLVGSEGTLGLFTAATLHTAPLPAHRGVLLLLFGQMETAVRAVQQIARHQPSACDLLDRRLLTLAREADARLEQLIAPAAEAALIVEQTGLSDREIRDRIDTLVRAVRAVDSSVVVAFEGVSPEDVEFLWSLPGKVVPLLTRLKGPSRPVPFVEDIAVPPPSMHEFLVRAQKVFQRHQVTASLYAHAASGQLHLRPFLPMPTPADGARLEAIARDLYQVVFALGGTMSGEHGDGLSRTAFIRSQYGPLYKLFQQVKDLFDPHNLLNPGKIISDDPHVTQKNIRPPQAANAELVELQLRWHSETLAESASACNGCGTCRTQSHLMRMCPFFRVDTGEEASPRAKANLIRNFTANVLDPRDMTSAGMKKLADMCFNCKQCQLECPSNVNIPQMMVEAKAAYVANNGLNRADWILSRAHSFGALGSTGSLLANWVIGNPGARLVAEKLLGIARQRKLPMFARRSFLRSAARSLLSPPKRHNGASPVCFFIGDYANYYDPELAHACVAVLRHNGIPVYVPPGQTASGMAMFSAGDLAAARDVAEQNVRELAELARDGYPIVCTEPSAALCLKQEYPMLLDHPDVELVASQVVEIGAFLEQRHREGKFRTDFAPLDLDVGYHTPCHLKALGVGTPLCRLMTLIPRLRVHTIDEGCSGMAGAYGLTRENFESSIRIGWRLISRMRDDSLNIGSTECSSCKFQMEQGTATPTIHPIKLLALSYGLMPEIRLKLRPAKRKLVVT